MTKLYTPIARSLAHYGLHWLQLHFIESRFMPLQQDRPSVCQVAALLVET